MPDPGKLEEVVGAGFDRLAGHRINNLLKGPTIYQQNELSNTGITSTQFACATFNNEVENPLIVMVVRGWAGWRDGS